MVRLEIDGRPVEVPENSTIMDAANRLGVYVPHFCYHRKLSIAANCRMCLVHVEKAPKPLPACATPATEGMKVWTHSEIAVQAQKGVMEFLLINHPLDCPVCDQGGECQLQDLAVGYGPSKSRYREPKRVVAPKDLGPLVAAEEMSRCIHCTRCVRFGQEIAGVMELGMAGRGEHAEIIAFVGRTVDSELSGNMIDLCPVGALTSKPFRFRARSWELARRRSVAPHDSLGSNLVVQVMHDRVMRVLPLENEEINECWLSDRDRFSYEGLNAPDRLTAPMIKREGAWQEVDWPTALDHAAKELARVRATHGGAAIGALAAPIATLEELYLLGELARGLGSANVDFRLRQSDFSAERAMRGVPWLGMKIADIGLLDRVLVVGSTLRKEQPLLAHRIRQAVKRGAQLCIVNPVDDDLLTRVHAKRIVAPSAMPLALAEIAVAAARLMGVAAPAALAGLAPGEEAQRIAQSLTSGERPAILLGNLAAHHPARAQLQALAAMLAETAGARFGFLGESANSVGGYLARAWPGAEGAGRHVLAMLQQPLKAYLLLHAEPEFDISDPRLARFAMSAAECVIALSPYRHGAMDYAQVLLPVAPFTETPGTFVNAEGRLQRFQAVVRPLGQARPAWKVLRVLGTLLGIAGFGYETIEDVRRALDSSIGEIAARLDNRLDIELCVAQPGVAGLERVGEVPIYHTDGIVRRASSLQRTRDAQVAKAWLPGQLIERLGLQSADLVRVTQDGASVVVGFGRDDRLPPDCVRLATACPETSRLGAPFGTVSLERAPAHEKAGV
ncbi:MAG TPA: NADH-quinone oxidoreductase subunit NuoG [Burkholderiales bacterium]|jgi:NADH-quinone oxidoreductase subunit G|nr:NADH-quinone oxidoreductase subunit NuoG [Burkholderiales bacterium]